MREVNFSFNRLTGNFLRWTGLFAVILTTALAGCKVGLGDSVDTEAPSVGILYPDPKSNAIIRDEFVLYGSCQDDKQITAVKVTLINIDSGETVLSDAPAVVDSDQKHWRIKLNSYSEDNKYNGWQFADGKYTVTVRAYDGSHDSSSDEKSSASSSFEIDNTAPVFVIKNPGVLKSENTSPSAYGSIFTVEGTISELHSVSSMEVTVYNEAGECVSEGSYNGEELKAFVEEDIEIAGGTSVIIAQSGAADGRYGKIYGDASGTQRYTCSIKLTDNSKKYVTPPETSDNRTAEKAALGESGNSTYKIYLYDDVYDTLLSQKNEGSKKLSAGDLKNIINGTVADEEARKILLDAEKDTDSAKDATKRLYFSLNPEANPTYNVNGFEYSFDKTDSLQQASAGNAVSVTVSQGLDQTMIDLDGNEKSNSTVKVWMKEFAARPLDEAAVKDEITAALAPKVKDREDEGNEGFVEYVKGTEEVPVTEVGGWKLIFDYGQNNSGESSVSTKTFSVTLPAGSIALNKYYLLAVTGRDIDNVEFSQNTIYGFEGNEAGVPPTLSIEDVYADDAKTVKNLKPSSDFEFKGKATLKSSSLYTSEFMVKLTVTDQDSDKVIDTVTQTVTRSALDKPWSETAALKFSDKENWTFKPDLLGNESIKVEAEAGKSYLYTLEVWGKASSGHESSSTLNVQIDSTKPKVEITSITPTVEEYNETKGPFVNGKIYVKGTVEETNLENVEIEVLVGGEVKKQESLGKKYSINYEIDTTTLTDNYSLEVKLIAVDKVGNKWEFSSADLSDYKGLQIYQESDRPIITLNNASKDVQSAEAISTKSNLFGTLSNNKLTATISDDDSIVTVKVTVYDSEGNKIEDKKVNSVYGVNPFELPLNKTSYTLSYALPPEEGVYKICVEAFDYVKTETNSKPMGEGSTGTFCVAVSAGAPTIKLDTEKTYLTANPTFSGTVSSALAKVSAKFTAVNVGGNPYTDDQLLTESEKIAMPEKAADSTSWKVSLKDGQALENGKYTIRFTSANEYGEENAVETEFTVDSVQPELTITEYNGISGNVSEHKTFYLNPNNIKTIKGICSDNLSGSGIENVFYYVGAVAEGKTEPSTDNGWSLATLTKADAGTGWSITLSNLDKLVDGSEHAVHIMATDKAGNLSKDNTYITLHIDKTGPVISNAKVDDSDVEYEHGGKKYKVYKSNIFNVSANVSDAVSGVGSVSANSTTKLNPNAEGVYEAANVSAIVDSNGYAKITITALDTIGNSAEEVNIDYLFIDTMPPEVSVTSYPLDVTNAPFTLSGNVSDNVGLAEVIVTDSLDKDKTYTATVNNGTWTVDLNPTQAGTGVNATKDGKHTYTVTATDKVGNKATGTCQVTTDTTPPTWVTGGEAGKEPYVSSTRRGTITVSDTEYSLYKSDSSNTVSISVAAKAADATTGVENLLYNLNDAKGDDDQEIWNTQGNDSIKIESGLDEGVNKITIKAKDSAGNESTPVYIYLFMDSKSPETPVLKTIDDDDSVLSTTTKYVNGTKEVKFTVDVKDVEGGSGIASVVLTGIKSGNSTTSKNIAGAKTEEGGSVYSVTIPAGDLASGAVVVTATDKAGNSTSAEMFTLVLDETAPSVEYTNISELQDVNGLVDVKFNITETNLYKAILYYSTTKSNDWNDYHQCAEYFDKGSYEKSINVTELSGAADTADGKAVLYLFVAATDLAGNTNYTDGNIISSAGLAEISVDLNGDVPTVEIENLTVEGDEENGYKYWLTESKISGELSDDDGIEDFKIFEVPIAFDGSGNLTTSVTGTLNWTKGKARFEYTCSDKTDGNKTLYFYIKDSAGGVFYTGQNNSKQFTEPVIKVTQSEPTEFEKSSPSDEGFAYVYDGTSPAVWIEIAYSDKNTGFETLEFKKFTGEKSITLGGDVYRYVKFKVKATDNNGIKKGTIQLGSESEVYLSFIEGEDSVFTAETDVYDLSKAGLGATLGSAVTVTAVVYDNSGRSGTSNPSFVLDNEGPKVEMTSPLASDTVSGSAITVSGTASDKGGSEVQSIYWLIPTTTEQTQKDEELVSSKNWAGTLTSTATVNVWSFVFNGKDNDLLSKYTDGTTDYASPDDNGIYTLPIYFKATDSLGNFTICKDNSIKYNPDADRPVSTITYPDSSVLAKDDTGKILDYAVLGGKIRITGNVEIPSGDSTAYKVFLQIADNKGDFGESDKEKAEKKKDDGGYGFTTIDASNLENSWQNDCATTGTLSFSNDGEDGTNGAKRAAWWGIPATLYSSKTSWYIVINDTGSMNPKTGTNNIKIRACAVGENGKVGLWTESYSIHIDSQVPVFTDAPVLYQYASAPANGDAFYKATPSAEKSYVSGMYLKGQWYMCTSVTDETPVKIKSVNLGNTTLTAGTDYFVYPAGAENSSGTASGSNVQVKVQGENGKDNYLYIAYVYIKIDDTKTSTQSYKVEAEDSDADGKTSEVTYEVNADNTAPIFSSITDGADNEIAMTKLKNSEYVVTFASSATDSGSGFERVAFYFKRTVDEKTTVELPIPQLSGSVWTNSKTAAYVGEVADSGLTIDTGITDSVDSGYSANNLYGVTLSGTTASSSETNTTTFTATKDISAYKFIRKGGLIKLTGVYYKIEGVEDKAITVDGVLSSSPDEAFVPAALVIDNTSTEGIGTWSNGYKITNDDGDGIIESVKNITSTSKWEVSVFSDELKDGPVTLVTMVFDKAGNVRTRETPVMIANNTPRLAKVYLATDLNGDGKFSDNELGSSKMSDTNNVERFYSALTNGTTGSAQEVVTITNGNDPNNPDAGIIMRGDLGLAFEFVGSGFEGYGAGNSDLYYKLAVGDSGLKAPTPEKDGKIEVLTNATFDDGEKTVTKTIINSGLKGFTIGTGKIKSSSYNEWAYANVDDTTGEDKNKKNYISVTLWDSTKGTTPGTGDTLDKGKITKFGSQWTVVNIPLYIDLVDDKAPVSAIADPVAGVSDSTPTGHVDLSSTLPSVNFTGASGEFDKDTKVSGKVVFTGTINDETRVNAISLTTTEKFSGTAISSTQVATYDKQKGSFTITQPATGLTFEITKNYFSTESGHTVEWKLTVDTSVVEGIAATDVIFTVEANDGTNSYSADYQVDIVPYITGIERSSTTKSTTTMNRSTYGEYPVAVGDTLKVSGWNFGTSPTVNVGKKPATAKEADGTSFTIKIDASENPKDELTNSGELTVTVNDIVSLNDKNNNATKTNLDSDKKFDNRYIRVWDVGHYFTSSLSGYKPTMAADKKGNLFSTWTSMGSALVTIQKNLKGLSKPAFVSYDQPDKESWISVDKSIDEGNISMIYMPAHVGSSGRGTYNCYADSPSIGGAWGTGIPNDITASSYYAGFRTDEGNKYVDIKIDGNPYTKMDKTKSAGFQLASYAMRRDVSQFTNGRSARFGNHMHFAYYDTKNKALRYTYQPLVEGAEDTENGYKNIISGWILIDGQSDGQDRIHKHDDTSIDSWNLGAGTLSTDKKAVTFTNTPSGTAGDTLGISYESKGGEHKLDLFTVVSVNEKKVTFTGDFTAEVDSINGGAIYRGDSNVVTKGARSTSAGSYLAMDVTSTGKPVIVYFDAASECLKIAYSTSPTPSMTNVTNGCEKFTRQSVSITDEDASSQGGTYVQARIDGNNYLHIVYRDGDGKLCYLKSKNKGPEEETAANYTFGKKLIVDNGGTYATISVIKKDSTYVPCVSWLNSEGTANGVKYALLRDVDTGNGNTESLWDVQIVPAVVDGGNHYVSGGELVYVEGKSGSWSVTEDEVSMSECDAVVGFNTGRMDVVFLKSEK